MTNIGTCIITLVMHITIVFQWQYTLRENNDSIYYKYPAAKLLWKTIIQFHILFIRHYKTVLHSGTKCSYHDHLWKCDGFGEFFQPQVSIYEYSVPKQSHTHTNAHMPTRCWVCIFKQVKIYDCNARVKNWGLMATSRFWKTNAHIRITFPKTDSSEKPHV